MERQNALLSPQKGKNTWYTQETDGLRVMRQVVRAHRTVSAGLRLLCSPLCAFLFCAAAPLVQNLFPFWSAHSLGEKDRGPRAHHPALIPWPHASAPRFLPLVPDRGDLSSGPTQAAVLAGTLGSSKRCLEKPGSEY